MLLESMNTGRLDEGSGLELTFQQNAALFHQFCRYKFNKAELKRKYKLRLAVPAAMVGLNDETHVN